ncbi:branched-chain amino acid ABC transporter [Desulfocucumis palustris]|uniref:Branched-chain amino acid ABC transporter n=1 Tax=Desulfocucumis palustris TaxID=1898651 RepID=A0A2L2XDI9_9FIRM|nr:ABC transporter substrate-binding protein [Desulfocucumis palustris]GBF34419.1 branched-chain amino acid ABC transporter [Desulfocucumis palustris]
MFRCLKMILLVTFLLTALTAPAYADSSSQYKGYPVVKVSVDGKELKGDVPAIIMDGRTLVPLRSIGEALGMDIKWDDTAKTVYIQSTPGGGITTPAQAAAKETVNIGLLAPLSGDVSSFGQSLEKAFILAVEEKSKIGDYTVTAFTQDDRNDPTEAVSMATKLIKEDKVNALIGSLTSRCSIPLATLAGQEKIPMITPTATSPKVTEGSIDGYAFRACFEDPYQGKLAAKFSLDNLNKKTAAVLYDKHNDYSLMLAENFKESFTTGGGTITGYIGYEGNDTDFGPVLTDIAEENPDVLYLPDYYIKVGLIGKQAREKGVKAVFVGSDGWDSPNLDYAAMEGGYFTNHYSNDDPRPEVKAWVEKYRAKYGSDPDIIAALGYDATGLLLKAIETANSNDPVKIREALKSIGNYPGVTGGISFDKDGNPIKSGVIMQVKSGQLQYVTTINP